jgi:tetratricopeptide (TPR) repeat protein
MANENMVNDATRDYAGLLLKHHELDPKGEIDSGELAAICAEMEVPWSRMDGRQRRLMRGLSEDLYALADGRSGTPMSAAERERWAQERAGALAADPIVQLEFLRRPYPPGFPEAPRLALQARAWERVGLPEVAVLFWEECGKTRPEAKAAAMTCLRGLGRVQEAAAAAWKLLRDPRSGNSEIYLAASTLFLIARELEPSNPERVFEEIADPLLDALEAERKIPLPSRKDPGLERSVVRAIAFVLLALDRRDELRDLCDDVLESHPDESVLLIARGMLNFIEEKLDAAEADFTKAIAAGARHGLPYAVLAWFRGVQGQYAELLRLSSEALTFPDILTQLQSCLFELRAVAQTMLNQPPDRVEEEFALALALNPSRAAQIEQNRQIAVAFLSSQPTATPTPRWSLPELGSDLWKARSQVAQALFAP